MKLLRFNCVNNLFVYKLSLRASNLGDDVKPRHVGCTYNDIRDHIISIILYMLGLGGVIERFYEPNKVAGWVKKPVRTGSV